MCGCLVLSLSASLCYPFYRFVCHAFSSVRARLTMLHCVLINVSRVRSRVANFLNCIEWVGVWAGWSWSWRRSNYSWQIEKLHLKTIKCVKRLCLCVCKEIEHNRNVKRKLLMPLEPGPGSGAKRWRRRRCWWFSCRVAILVIKRLDLAIAKVI